MDGFAWLRPAAPAEPEIRAAVAVAERPEPLRTPDQQKVFVYNPWKLKELRRLYVNLPDGTKVGYLDLASMAAVSESPDTAGLLQRALADLVPGASSFAQNLPPAGALMDLAAAPSKPLLPWIDLSSNRPGQLIENLDDVSYKAGVAGEQRTAGVLAGLEREGYKVLHSVPLSPRKDIDHLVIGPSGIHAVNTKSSSYEVTAKDDAVYADGYRQKWIDSITRDAGLAGEYLARAARMELEVQPLVAVWSSIGVTSSSPQLVAGEDLGAVITGHAQVIPAAWLEVAYNVARRSDTWTANH